eukprot:jgi/Botrbrau1/17898/Bobra.0432s0003.1
MHTAAGRKTSDSRDRSLVVPGSPGDHAPRKRSTVRYVAVVAAFLVLNSTLNMMNRWLLGIQDFKFPIFLTICHLGIGVLVLAPLMLHWSYRQLHWSTLQSQWRGIAAMAACKAANIGLNNMSLVLITLSLNQIIRSSIPVAAALLALALGGSLPSGFELLSLSILATGVGLGCWDGSVQSSPRGVALCVAGTLAAAAMLNFSGRVLSEKVDVLRLTFYTSPLSIVLLLPFFAAFEAKPLVAYLAQEGHSVVWWIAAGGINAVAYNLVHYLMIQTTSAVTTPVIGSIKVVALVVLSAALLGEATVFTVTMTIGCTLAVSGFALYSYAVWEAAARGKTVYIKGGTELPESYPAGTIDLDTYPLKNLPAEYV